MRFTLLAAASLALALSGCALGPTAASTAEAGAAISGAVHGGQQPITSAHVYLFAASSTGYGGSGIPASPLNASTSLLTSGDGTDSTGTYVLTNGSGSFNITSSQYTCIPGTQVYMYSQGGDPGAGANASAALLAILGTCPAAQNFIAATPFVTLNEVTTVAAAYAFAGFASDATHVSSSSSALARTGLANAFANAGNLVSLAFGAPLTSTPAGNGTPPYATIGTLANILAACVNSNGSTTVIDSGSTSTTSPAPCGTLFANATSNGLSSGTQPTDTASAAINIAHFPGANVAALYGLQAANPPFAIDLASQPNDLTLGVNYTGGALNGAQAIAIDASGNAWVANATGNNVTELSSLGAILSGSTGYTGGNLGFPSGIAIDTAGNAWIANGNSSVTRLSPSGQILSGSTGYTGGGLTGPFGIAIDGSGNVWVTNAGDGTVTELASSGTPISSGSGFTGGSLGAPLGIAIDGTGNAWIANSAGNNVVKLSPTGSVLSGTNGFTGGGLIYPYAIALDSSGNAWTANSHGEEIAELSNSGSILSGSSGYFAPGAGAVQTIAIDGAGNIWTATPANNTVSEIASSGSGLSGTSGYTSGGLNYPYAIALDSSGNAWIANSGSNTVTQLIGVAAPVITPIAAGLPATPTANGSSQLGTRP